MSGILNAVAAAAGGGGLFQGTLTAGQSGSNVGYESGFFGALSPTKDSKGHTISNLYDLTTGSVTLDIAGFSADPTTSYIKQLQSNGHTLLPANASYTYAGGIAQWVWNSTYTLGYASGTAYGVLII